MFECHEIPTYAADREPHKQSARGVILYVRVNSVGYPEMEFTKVILSKVVGFLQLDIYSPRFFSDILVL